MELNTTPNEPSLPLADDLLRGADAIAEFIFGERGSRRKIYYLAETFNLPVFRLGSVLCARRSVLIRWIVSQESRVRGPRASIYSRVARHRCLIESADVGARADLAII